MDDLEAARDELARAMAITPAQTIAVLNHLGIADLLIDGPQSVEDLAAQCHAHTDALYRLLRFACSHGVFTEVEPRRFGQSRLSHWLRSDVEWSMRWRADSHTLVRPWLPWEEWLETVQTGEPAYDRMHGRSFWDALAADDEARAIFDASLRVIAARQIDAIVPTLSFEQRALVVDVGAGDGSWLAAILRRMPELRAVAYELPQARDSLTATLGAPDLAGRAEIVTGDFFSEVPAGDVLLLANVLHDWDDEKATTLLARCRDAISEDGRLVVVDRVLPDGDVPHHGKTVDINMLFLLGGRERTRREHASLLAGARFDLVDVADVGLQVSVLTAIPT